MPKKEFVKLKSTKQLKVNYHNKKTIETRYNGRIGKVNLRKYIQKISNRLKEKGFKGSIGTAIKLDTGEWRGTQFRNVGEPISLYLFDYNGDDDINQDYVSEFSIYIFDGLTKKGGTDDEHNDCLFNCLRIAIPNDNPFKFPQQLKRFLKVERDEKISIDLIHLLDKKLKNCKINIYGDYIYTSPKDCKREININLIDGHYSLNNSFQTYKYHTKYDEKKPIICFKYKDISKKGFCLTFDGTCKKDIKNDEIYKNRYNYKSDINYILSDSKLSIEETFDKFIEDANILKDKTDGVINLYKTGSNYDTALNLFNKFTKTINPEPILHDEALWINECMTSSIIWSNEYKGEAYKYDYISMYPSIMRDSYFMVPIKCGEFTKIDTLPETPKCGIYRCKIIQKTPSDCKLFKF